LRNFLELNSLKPTGNRQHLPHHLVLSVPLLIGHYLFS